jgi:hypothetical protein
MLSVLRGGGFWDPIGGDLHGYFLPRYEESGRALLHEGRLPLWNPYEFGGTPHFGAIQSATLYPPIPLLFGSLSAWAALQALYAFHILLLSWGTIAYLRGHGIPRWCGAIGATIAVAGTFTGASLGGIDHPNFLGSAAWIPLLLLCFERAIDAPRPWLGLLAVTYAMQWLVGYPDFPLDTAVLLGITALLEPHGTLLRRTTILAAGGALGVASIGFQMVPAWESVRESIRVLDPALYEMLRNGFASADAASFTIDLPGRFGMAATVLLVLGIGRARTVRWAWLVALAWCTFALDWPLRLLYRLPPFDGVRFPYGWSHIAPLFVGFLAASGLAWLWSAPSRATRSVLPAQIGAATLALLALVSSAQTVSAIRAHVHPAPDRAVVDQRMATLRELRRRYDPHARIVSGPDAAAGGPLRNRVPSITGYDPSSPLRRPVRLLQAIERRSRVPGSHVATENDPGLASLVGVGFVTVPSGWQSEMRRKGFSRIAPLPPGDVVVYQRPVPRARIVHRAHHEVDEQASFQRTVAGEDDRALTTVLEGPGDPPHVEQPASGSTESARIVRDEPELVEVEVDAAADGILVLADTHYPGWEATVDGVATPIWIADYAFRGVAVRGGTHRVVFRFAPRTIRLGMLATVPSAIVLAWLLAPLVRRSRRNPPAAA